MAKRKRKHVIGRSADMAKIKDKLEYSIKNIDKQSMVFPYFVMSIGAITVNLSSELLNGNGPGLFGQNTKKRNHAIEHDACVDWNRRFFP